MHKVLLFWTNLFFFDKIGILLFSNISNEMKMNMRRFAQKSESTHEVVLFLVKLHRLQQIVPDTNGTKSREASHMNQRILLLWEIIFHFSKPSTSVYLRSRYFDIQGQQHSDRIESWQLSEDWWRNAQKHAANKGNNLVGPKLGTQLEYTRMIYKICSKLSVNTKRMISLIFLGSITVNFEQISCTHWYGDFPIDLDHPSRQLHV